MLEVVEKKEIPGIAKSIPGFLLSIAASFALCLLVVGAAFRFTFLSPAFYARQAEDRALEDVVEQSVLAELEHIAYYTDIPEDLLVKPVQPQIKPLLKSSLLDIPPLLTGKLEAYSQVLEESELLSAVLAYGQVLEEEGAGVFDSVEAKAIVGEIGGLLTNSIRIINAEQLLTIKLLQPLLLLCRNIETILLAGLLCVGLLLAGVFFLERKRYQAYFAGVCFTAGLLLLVPCLVLIMRSFSNELAIALPELRLLLGNLISGILANIIVMSLICLLWSGIFVYMQIRFIRRNAVNASLAMKQ